MRIIAPAGIGDWSWMWSKLWFVRDQISSIRIVDGAPRRTVPYVKCCGVMDADYDTGPDAVCGTNYQTILMIEHHAELDFRSIPTWKKIRAWAETQRKEGHVAKIPLEANQHLEAGLPLADWLPDLPTNYHYPLFIRKEEEESGQAKTKKIMEGDGYGPSHPMKEGPVVGISCASYKGAEAWDTWGRVEWVEFLKRVMTLGWRPLLVGGAWDDLTYTVATELELPSCVGKTSVPEMIAQMNLLESYIGYSSGMNVIRTVLNKPAMALWPCNKKCDQEKLSRSWAPPHMLENERYVAVTWNPVDDVWPVAKAFLRRCEKELKSGTDKTG